MQCSMISNIKELPTITGLIKKYMHIPFTGSTIYPNLDFASLNKTLNDGTQIVGNF